MGRLVRIIDVDAKKEWEPILGTDVLPIKEPDDGVILSIWFYLDLQALSLEQVERIVGHLVARDGELLSDMRDKVYSLGAKMRSAKVELIP